MEPITDAEFRRLVRSASPDAPLDFKDAADCMRELGISPETLQSMRANHAKQHLSTVTVLCFVALIVTVIYNLFAAKWITIGWNTTSPVVYRATNFLFLFTLIFDGAVGFFTRKWLMNARTNAMRFSS